MAQKCLYPPCSENGSNTSHNDIVMVFNSGRAWKMPDTIVHCITEHNWLPPDELIADIMQYKLFGARYDPSVSSLKPMEVGYLSGSFEKGDVPEGFVLKLTTHIKTSIMLGNKR